MTTPPAFLVLGFLPTPGPFEMMIIGVIALLLFGKRLPEMARSVGQSFGELKRGLNDSADDVKGTYRAAVEQPPREIASDTRSAGVAKFEPAHAPDEAPVTTADAPTPEAGVRGAAQDTEEPATSS